MKKSFGTVVVLLCVSTGTAFAELQPRDNGMIYDTDLNITWIADTHLARTLGDERDGTMHYQRAVEWVEGLDYGGFSDWRLPTITDPDPNCTFGDSPRGMNCTLSEMGHLFYVELGGRARSHILQSGNGDVNLFTFDSLGPNPPFWAASLTSGQFGGEQPDFSFSTGRQGISRPRERLRVLAVRDGDVARGGGNRGNSNNGNDNSGRGRGNAGQGNSGSGQGNTNTETDTGTGNGSGSGTGSDTGSDGFSGGPSTPVPEAPNFSAPTGLTISNVGGDRLRFTWQDNSNNEDGFVIERLLPMTASATSLIATVRGAGDTTGTRSHTVTIQGARSNFCYHVRAFRGTSKTETSNRACAGLD